VGDDGRQREQYADQRHQHGTHDRSGDADRGKVDGRARWMSCEVGEVGRSISVFYGGYGFYFVRGFNLFRRCSQRSAGYSRRGNERCGVTEGVKVMQSKAV
jgi:hypothetical protein